VSSLAHLQGNLGDWCGDELGERTLHARHENRRGVGCQTVHLVAHFKIALILSLWNFYDNSGKVKTGRVFGYQLGTEIHPGFGELVANNVLGIYGIHTARVDLTDY